MRCGREGCGRRTYSMAIALVSAIHHRAAGSYLDHVATGMPHLGGRRPQPVGLDRGGTTDGTPRPERLRQRSADVETSSQLDASRIVKNT
jgi:hypothetical protein